MTLDEVRSRYFEFFKKRNHAIISFAPIVPDNDSTTLFTSSGMQPLLPYLLGEAHPEGARLVNSQMCFRSEDIEEVGDNRHTTFFEMLGNWSLGDYFKKEQLSWVFEFLTSKEEGLGLDPEKLYVTVFAGDEESKMDKDTDAIEIWKELFATKGIGAKLVELGTETRGGEVGMSDGRIFSYGAKKNWWSRSGTPAKMPAGEPGGPDSEIFYDFGTPHNTEFGVKCHPNCDCGRFVEIGNSVFMQYVKQEDGTFSELPKKNVDFGGGLERLTAAANDNEDIFSIDVFDASRAVLMSHSDKAHNDSAVVTRAFRIILDHIRSATFMLASGITPSNTEQGYVLRRLIRRAVREVDRLGIKESVLTEVAQGYGSVYATAYPFVQEAMVNISEELEREENKFRKALANGMRIFERKVEWMGVGDEALPKGAATMAFSAHSAQVLPSEVVFELYTTYGFPIEMTQEIAKEKGIVINNSEVALLIKEHQEKSRAGAAQKFKGGLADTAEETTALHTATHLMLAGLRKYLGEGVHQAGSNITAERTRFDFTHGEKVSREILDKVETYVNEAIDKNCTVTIEQVSKEVARADGVEASFWEKYPDIVKVYTVTADDGTVYSRELCGGPHVEKTGAMNSNGKHFKILKESSSSAGVRRIKATFM